MKDFKSLKLIEKTIERTFKKIFNGKKFKFLENNNKIVTKKSGFKTIDYEITESDSEFNLKAYLKLKKDYHTSNLETYELVKFIGILDRVKKYISDHLDLDLDFDDDEDSVAANKTKFGFKADSGNNS